jgi:integrase
MAIKKLTKSVIDSLPIPNNGRITYWDTELKGFCIRVSRTAKTYYAKKRVMGKPRWVKIGEHGLLTPDEARKEALNILSDLNKGVDVNKQKAQDRIRGITLKEAIDEYFTSKPQLREGSKRTYECLLNEWLPDWMDKPIEEINKNTVAKRHLKIASERSEVSANNVMRTFRAIYNHAQAVSDGALPENPTKILSRSRQWFHVGRRQTIIKEHQLKAWHEAVKAYSNPVASDALLLLLLTGCREKEVLTLRWEDVDMTGLTFTICADVAKNHREHTLPMSNAIFDIFNRRLALRENEWVFPGQGPKGHLCEIRRAVEAVMKKSKVKFCIHDLRRTFTSIAEQEVSYAILKRLLNHYTGNDVTAGYLIIPVDQLRAPIQRVTSRVQKAFKGKEAPGKVINLRG